MIHLKRLAVGFLATAIVSIILRLLCFVFPFVIHFVHAHQQAFAETALVLLCVGLTYAAGIVWLDILKGFRL